LRKELVGRSSSYDTTQRTSQPQHSQVTFGVISVGMNIRDCQISDVTNQVLLRVAYG